MEKTSCVYCGKNNKCTREHVFPVSLGGDDRNFILSEEVCGKCNNFFSRLELKLARNHFVGLNRLLANGKKPGSDLIEDNFFATRFLDGNSQVFFDGTNVPLEVTDPGDQYVGSQVIIEGDMWYYVLPSDVSAQHFFEKEMVIFKNENIQLIRKFKVHDNSFFKVQPLFWNGSKYCQGKAYESAKPPVDGIWVENVLSEDEVIGLARIIVTSNGSIRLRCRPETDLADTCRLARKFVINAERETQMFSARPQKTVFTMTLGIEEAHRALAKIAFNFLIYRVGASNTSIPWFDKIKKYILLGKNYRYINYMVGEDAKEISDKLFGICPSEYHVVQLSIEPEGGDRYNIFCNARLYGQDFFSVMLGGRVPLPYGAPKDIAQYYVIDHASNKITPYSWRDYDHLYKVSSNTRIPRDQTYNIAPGIFVGDRESPLVDRKYRQKKNKKH